jgi:uncharacterized membrane protein
MFCAKCGAENPDDAEVCSKCGAGLAVSAGPSEGEAKPQAETSVGLSANVAGLLCYVLGWITGIIFVVLEKENKTVKFHAWQSIMTFGVLSVVWLIVFWIPVVNVIIWILIAVLWIILMIQAGSGNMWKLPWAGKWAEKQASK